MSIPSERTRALRYAKQFLIDLTHHSTTKRIPSEIRQRARDVLRHWPFDHELEDALKRSKYFEVEEEKK